MALLSNIPVTNLLSLSFASIEAFNEQAKIAFGLMLETTHKTSRNQISLGQRQQMIGWFMELLLQQGVSEKNVKRRSLTRTNFDLVNCLLYWKPDKTHQQQKVLVESKIWDAIIGIHNSLGHAGQDLTAKAIHTTYYEATREEFIFLIKLCEICHWKTHSMSKRPLKPIILIAIIHRVQINLIDIRSTTDITPSGIFLWIAHLVDHMSKQQMLAAMENKEAITVSRVVHWFICIYGVMDSLQSDNGSEFKGIYLALALNFGTSVINGWPRTQRTQNLVEQSNSSVKTRINAWKCTHGSTHWSECLDVSFYFSIYYLLSNF